MCYTARVALRSQLLRPLVGGHKNNAGRTNWFRYRLLLLLSLKLNCVHVNKIGHKYFHGKHVAWVLLFLLQGKTRVDTCLPTCTSCWPSLKIGIRGRLQCWTWELLLSTFFISASPTATILFCSVVSFTYSECFIVIQIDCAILLRITAVYLDSIHVRHEKHDSIHPSILGFHRRSKYYHVVLSQAHGILSLPLFIVHHVANIQ